MSVETIYKPDSLPACEAERQPHNVYLERGQEIIIKDSETNKALAVERVNNLRIRINRLGDEPQRVPRLPLEDGQTKLEKLEGKGIEIKAVGFVPGRRRHFEFSLEEGLLIEPDPKG